MNRLSLILLALSLIPALPGRATAPAASTAAPVQSSDPAALYQRAQELKNQGNAESYRQAIILYLQALNSYHNRKDRKSEALCLYQVGGVYFDLGQPQKALEYYQQALPIRREVGDRWGEATTLNDIGFTYRSSAGRGRGDPGWIWTLTIGPGPRTRRLVLCPSACSCSISTRRFSHSTGSGIPVPISF